MAVRSEDYPLTSMRFKLSIKGVDDHFASFAYCSGFSYKTSSFFGRFGDSGITGGNTMLTGYDFTPITFKRGVIEDVDLFKYVIRASDDFKNTPNILDDKTIILTVLKDNGDAGVMWTFGDCALSGYQLGPLDASRSEILMESFSFKFYTLEKSIPTLQQSERAKSQK